VVQQPSSTTQTGHVINTNPQFGNLEPANTVVTVYVSTGPKKISVPNVVGQNVTQAQSALSNAGLSPSVKTDPNSTKPIGTVVSQSPGGNTSVSPGSTVTIVVSGGGVTVPNELGATLQAAENALTQAGLSYQISYQTSTTTPNTVLGMNPKPESVVAKGTAVTLTVSQAAASTPPTSTPPTSTPPTSPTSTSPTTGGL
jgi:eukaryotic-like serine/threonine-protein kinase